MKIMFGDLPAESRTRGRTHGPPAKIPQAPLSTGHQPDLRRVALLFRPRRPCLPTLRLIIRLGNARPLWRPVRRQVGRAGRRRHVARVMQVEAVTPR